MEKLSCTEVQDPPVNTLWRFCQKAKGQLTCHVIPADAASTGYAGRKCTRLHRHFFQYRYSFVALSFGDTVTNVGG